VAAAHAREAARAVRARLPVESPGAEETVVLGPAALFRLRGRERETLLVKAHERRRAVRAVGDAVGAAAGSGAHPSVSFSVDVEPH
jgi:primosomal protein N' (replication factor Y)